MKIKFIAPIVALATAGLLTGCNPERLEIPQKGVVTMESYYQTDEDAQAALVAAYQGFLWNVCGQSSASTYAPYRFVFNLCGDDMYAAGAQYGDNDFAASMNEFRYDTSNDVIQKAYYGLYYALYYQNLVIDNFGYREDASEIMKNAVAEARVLRAFTHMMLAIGWGTPPLVDHVLGANDNPYNCNTDPENPMSHEDLLRWCANECELALPYLEDRKGPEDKAGAVKVTKGVANAVAGKALVFAGDYAEAAKYLEAVISSGNYKLVPGERWEENFHIEGDANEEKVFEANLEWNAGLGNWDYINRSTWMESQMWNWRSDKFVTNPTTAYSSIEGWGACGVPESFVNEFIANDGTDSYRFKGSIINIEDIIYNTVYGDPEIDDLTLEEKKVNKDKLGIKAQGLYGQSFYLPLKPVAKSTDLRNPGNNVRLNNFTLMRYAEVLLLYAEACVQNGEPEKAFPYVQELQQRANSQTVISSASELTMEVVEREKKLELWLEGCRWPDMVRWGHTDGVVNAGTAVPVLYDKLIREPIREDIIDPETGEVATKADENIRWQYGTQENSRYYLADTHVAKDFGAVVGFKAGKHERFPFPYQATSINPNITQNPGWTN